MRPASNLTNVKIDLVLFNLPVHLRRANKTILSRATSCSGTLFILWLQSPILRRTVECSIAAFGQLFGHKLIKEHDCTVHYDVFVVMKRQKTDKLENHVFSLTVKYRK